MEREKDYEHEKLPGTCVSRRLAAKDCVGTGRVSFTAQETVVCISISISSSVYHITLYHLQKLLSLEWSIQ